MTEKEADILFKNVPTTYIGSDMNFKRMRSFVDLMKQEMLQTDDLPAEGFPTLCFSQDEEDGAFILEWIWRHARLYVCFGQDEKNAKENYDFWGVIIDNPKLEENGTYTKRFDETYIPQLAKIFLTFAILIIQKVPA